MTQSLLLWALIVAKDAFNAASLYLGGIENIELIELSKGELEIQGEIQRSSDLKKIKQFTKDFPEVRNKTTLSPETSQQIERLLQKRLKILSPQTKLIKRGDAFFLSERVSAETLESLKKIYPQILTTNNTFPPGAEAPTVFLEVALIEVKRTALSRLGLRLESPLGLTTHLKGSLSSDPIRAFLDVALQRGEARVHAKQSVITQNGKQGTFIAGGEFPIKIVSGLVAKVDFKRFGLILNFTPQLQSQNRIHLQIDSEISDIDTGSMVDGIPVILKKEIRTQIFTTLGQMLAIAGLVENRQSEFRDQIPGLSAIPILGRLFESDDFKKHRSEAYIFVTPKKMDTPWLPSPEL